MILKSFCWKLVFSNQLLHVDAWATWCISFSIVVGFPVQLLLLGGFGACALIDFAALLIDRRDVAGFSVLRVIRC